MRSFFRFNTFFASLIVMALCFAACGGEANQDRKVSNQKADIISLFLAYTDSLTKCSADNFNEKSVSSLNEAFAGKLPLNIHQAGKNDDYNSVVIQTYENKDTVGTIKAGVILLVPKSISDSLHVGDFTRHFGNIKKEQPMIGVTELPLPVEIGLNNKTSIKLTFNNNKKLDSAHVTRVEILKYR